MNDILITAIIFFAIYQTMKLISDHLLRRKLIKAEQYERVGILEQPKPATGDENRYPSLKWGLVAFMAGVGFVIIEVLKAKTDLIDQYYRNATLPIGIILISVSLGFLIYFFIVNRKKK
jgi:hypothetical protein